MLAYRGPRYGAFPGRRTSRTALEPVYTTAALPNRLELSAAVEMAGPAAPSPSAGRLRATETPRRSAPQW